MTHDELPLSSLNPLSSLFSCIILSFIKSSFHHSHIIQLTSSLSFYWIQCYHKSNSKSLLSSNDHLNTPLTHSTSNTLKSIHIHLHIINSHHYRFHSILHFFSLYSISIQHRVTNQSRLHSSIIPLYQSSKLVLLCPIVT